MVDRLTEQAWTLVEVAAELRAAPSTVRILLEQHEVRRLAPTRRQRATGLSVDARGPNRQSQAIQQRRQARPGPGSASQRGRIICRIAMSSGAGSLRPCTELQIGHAWLDRHLTRFARHD